MVLNLFGWLGASPNKTRSRGSVSRQTEDNIRKEWANITVLMEGRSPSQLRQAVISADKTLDNALRDIVPGESMGERLKNAKDNFSSWEFYQKLWEAHKIRNNLVHESGYDLPYFMAQDAVNTIKRGLSELKINL